MTNGNGVSSTLQMKEMPEYLSDSTSDSVKVVVYPKEHLLATPASHQGYGAPMVQSSVTQASHDYSVIQTTTIILMSSRTLQKRTIVQTLLYSNHTTAILDFEEITRERYRNC